jgi:methylated-DNA-[protein]-cysteine S-methyltransferase
VITHFTRIDSPVGTLRLCAAGDLLGGLYFDDLERAPAMEGAGDGAKHPVIAETRRQLREYFAGERRAFDLPLAMAGTAFQRRVWATLQAIPFGETWSYTQLAKRAGRPAAMRAAGAANARNPISIIVPCHRVIGADGSLTGFGGGLPAKKWLLDHEASFGGSRSVTSAAFARFGTEPPTPRVVGLSRRRE